MLPLDHVPRGYPFKTEKNKRNQIKYTLDLYQTLYNDFYGENFKIDKKGRYYTDSEIDVILDKYKIYAESGTKKQIENIEKHKKTELEEIEKYNIDIYSVMELRKNLFVVYVNTQNKYGCEYLIDWFTEQEKNKKFIRY